MKVIVRTRNIRHTESLLNYVHARFTEALTNVSDRLGAVTIHLDREGKSDAICHVSASLIPRHHIEVSSRRAMLREAVDHAAETLGTAVARDQVRMTRRRAGHGSRRNALHTLTTEENAAP